MSSDKYITKTGWHFFYFFMGHSAYCSER